MVSAIEKQMLQSQVLDRIQQVQQQHPDMQQQYFNIQLSQERRRQKKRVNESDEIHDVRIGKKRGAKQMINSSQEQRTVEPESNGDISGAPEKLDHIDIKI